MSRDGTALRLGPEVVKLLVPQRPPLLMVDRISAVNLDAAEPSIVAHRYLSANDPVFAGHFPEVGVHPGVLTIEALAQAAGALGALLHLVEAHGIGVLDELRNVERGATFNPGFDSAAAAAFRARVTRPGGLTLGGAVSAKLLAPVFPGCRLDLRAYLARRIDRLSHFRLEASVDDEVVANGTISGARIDTSPR
jgi:3-hydroxymyristoyl/3-hydroxydecanoyl-(acyl carrier protein) dehydratase